MIYFGGDSFMYGQSIKDNGVDRKYAVPQRVQKLLNISICDDSQVSSPNKLVVPAESAVPHMLVRAAFGRRALEQLRVESRHVYLQLLNVALKKARELDQDVIDTAVELLLQRAEQ